MNPASDKTLPPSDNDGAATLASGDAARLIGRRLTSRRFYLIAQRRYTPGTEWIALPVTGDCELIFAEMIPASEADLPHVAGWCTRGELRASAGRRQRAGKLAYP